jgi:hypothetical protein
MSMKICVVLEVGILKFQKEEHNLLKRIKYYNQIKSQRKLNPIDNSNQPINHTSSQTSAPDTLPPHIITFLYNQTEDNPKSIKFSHMKQATKTQN